MNKFLSIIFIVTLTSISYSQFLNSYGIKVGTALSYHTMSSVESSPQSTVSRFGGAIGVFTEFKLSKHFYLLLEGLYLQNGAYIDVIENINTMEYAKVKTTIHYLSFPLMIKANINFNKLKPYAITGINYNFILGYNENGLKGFYQNIYKMTKFGISIGLGIDYRLPKKFKLLFECTYNYLGNYPVTTYSYNNIYTYSGETYSNRSINFFIGFGF